MRLAALIFLLPIVLSAADTPIRIPAAPNGTSLQLDRLPLTATAKLDDTKYQDESILTVQLIPSGPAAKQLPALTLPLRFEPGEVGDVPTMWTRQSSSVAFILPCHAPRQDRANRLFIFRVADQQLRAVALPDLATHITRIRRDIAELTFEFQSSGCFGWIGEDLLVVQFTGGCLLDHDVGGTESREISGHAVFQLDADGNANIREVLSLKIQG